MTRTIFGDTIVYWLAAGWYLPHATDSGLRWHRQFVECPGAVYANQAYDLRGMAQ